MVGIILANIGRNFFRNEVSDQSFNTKVVFRQFKSNHGSGLQLMGLSESMRDALRET